VKNVARDGLLIANSQRGGLFCAKPGRGIRKTLGFFDSGHGDAAGRALEKAPFTGRIIRTYNFLHQVYQFSLPMSG